MNYLVLAGIIFGILALWIYIDRNTTTKRMRSKGFSQELRLTWLGLKYGVIISAIVLVGFTGYVYLSKGYMPEILTKKYESTDPFTMKINALMDQNKEKDDKIDKLIAEKLEIQNLSNEEINVLNGEIKSYKDKNEYLASLNGQRTQIDYGKVPKSKIYIGNLIIREWKRQGGTDDLVPLTICMYESEFDALRLNAGTPSIPEHSMGLFQVNTDVHGSRLGYKAYHRLYEPLFNIQFQFPELVRFEKKGIAKGLRGEELAKYVARYGQRPYWTNALSNKIGSIYRQFESAKVN